MRHCVILFSCCMALCFLVWNCGTKTENKGSANSTPITISSPEPSGTISAISLSDGQKQQLQNGNAFALRCMQTIYSQGGGENILLSPLSLQYALAMATNGASGKTAEEITSTLGYSSDLPGLNAFMKQLMDQLPALDANVELKVTNAMLTSDKYKVQSSFKETLNSGYYAPVEYVNMDDISLTVNRINEWASRNTNGFINPFITENDLPSDLVSVILNALYFKAKWSEYGGMPIFNPDFTNPAQPFYCADGTQTSADYMRTSIYFDYAKRDGYQAIELPYAGRKFAMYVLLPDSKDAKNGVGKLLEALPDGEWKALLESMKTGPEVHLSLPKFDITEQVTLRNTLEKMGINRAFDPAYAEFDRMIEDGSGLYISGILQKSRISVTEWGTEAASVTMVMIGKESEPGEHEEVTFIADHPFVYIIAEKSSGAILFEGVFGGK